MEFLKPQIFDEYPVLCGMSIKGDMLSFPPSGFSFRQVQHTEDEFRKHIASMNQSIGPGIGKRIASLHQVHGTQIYDADIDSLPDGDGLYTNNPDVVLGIALADCCGIMIYDPIHTVIMALHAGWRGAKNGIATKGIAILKSKFHAKPADLLIWLTPCAGNDIYEVGPEFLEYFPGFVIQKGATYILDLKAYIISELLKAGIQLQHIESSTLCTIQDMRFHSYRREGNSGRNVAFMGLLGEK